MNKKMVVVSTSIIVIIGLFVCINILQISYASFFHNNSNEVLSKFTEDIYDNHGIISLYVDGNVVQSMTSVPEGYAIDEENSYCYTTNKNDHDENAILYTNNNGEHVFGNLSKGEKCVIYFKQSLVLITFTIDGQELTAEEGMTWVEWVNSPYNLNSKYSLIQDVDGDPVELGYNDSASISSGCSCISVGVTCLNGGNVNKVIIGSDGDRFLTNSGSCTFLNKGPTNSSSYSIINERWNYNSGGGADK